MKTNKKGWTEVEYLGSIDNGRVLLKLPDGQIIKRKNKNIRSVFNLVNNRFSTEKSKYWKQFKTKKKRKRVLKRGKNKRYKVLSNKWKDPKIPRMPRKEI